jgi:hypothetical protein
MLLVLLLDAQILNWRETLAKSGHTNKEEIDYENWKFFRGAALAPAQEHDGLC